MVRSIRAGLTLPGQQSKLYQPTLYTVVGFLCLWQFLSVFFSPRDLPGIVYLAELVIVIVSGNDQFVFIDHAWITIQRVVIGFVLTMIIGVSVGITMGLSRYREYLTVPVMVMVTFPAVVWAFILVMWFGITEYVVMVATIVLAVTPYVIVNVWKGTESLDGDLLEMAQTFDLSRSATVRHVILPMLLPFLMSSGRLAFALAWKLSLVAEIFGSSMGIGYVVNFYFTAVRADMIIAWAIPMMLLMYGIERLLKRVEHRAFAWRPNVQEVSSGVNTA